MRIAITGGIAEGKSTVMAYLRDLGHQTASSDEIARDVFQSEHVQEALSLLLGKETPISQEDVRHAIAQEHRMRRTVNRIMHPQILQEIARCPATFFEVPLLYETCIQGMFDCVWVVTCGKDEQLKRLSIRLESEEKAREMLQIQLATDIKSVFADKIIRTNRLEPDVIRCVKATVAREIG